MINISASNPFIAYKHAIDIALGGRGSARPTFKERKLYGFVFQDTVEEYEYTFDDLNYKFVEELPVSDITVFTSEEFGKFFYEYGRTLLGNLMICLTKADWNSVAQGSNQEATYVSNYYNSLISMDDHLEKVVEEFKKVALSEYGEFPLDVHKASSIIREYKNVVASARYSTDMKNNEIFYVSYIGLMFTLYGLFLILPEINDGINVFSFLKSPSSSSVMELYKSILTKDYGDVDVKRRFISLVYAFYKTTDFLRLTSGLADMDSMIGTLYDVSKNFISKLDSEDDDAINSVRALIDTDLVATSQLGSGLSIASLTGPYDPVLEVLGIRNGMIIPKDNPNIWRFGDTYIRGYKFEIEQETTDGKEYKTIAEIVNPIMKCFLSASMKSSYTNEDIERAFRSVANIVTFVDSEDISVINPGFILQLTIMAAAFRVLDKRTTSRSESNKRKINASIDILDVLIYKLYDLWFKSGKYFKQPNRPKYNSDDSCNGTLSVLQHECDEIILSYLEFVRFGVETNDSDKLLLKTTKSARILRTHKEHLNEFITSTYACPDQNTLIRLCGAKEGRSILQTVYEHNTQFEFVNLVISYAKELPESFIANFASDPENHTGISIIDRVIDVSLEARSNSSSNPEEYCVGIYGVIWTYFENAIKKHNSGNYFDFGDANRSLTSYNVEHVVADSIGRPLKNKISFNSL